MSPRPVALNKLPPETYALVSVLDQAVKELERIGDHLEELVAQSKEPLSAPRSLQAADPAQSDQPARKRPHRRVQAPDSNGSGRSAARTITREERTA